MTERTFTEEEIREAIARVTTSRGLMDELMTELTRPKPPGIPEGVLCWGWNEWGKHWEPCVSRGNGTAAGSEGTYSTIRLANPDDWAAAPEWAKLRAINRSGEIIWLDDTMGSAQAIGFVYVEGQYNE